MLSLTGYKATLGSWPLLQYSTTSGKCSPGNLAGLPQILPNLDFFGPNYSDCLDCLALDPPVKLPPAWRQITLHYLPFAVGFQAVAGWVGSTAHIENMGRYLN
jgi:hypothetical protein